ncbi:MAG: hypothetical protein IJI98_03265 [Methanosphaera sp.]|nr:hypothetical protein [Methanosphaera sp.]
MCGIRFFETKRLGFDTREEGRKEKGTPSNARSITEIVNILYEELLQYDYKLEELYDMTVKELTMTLESRRKGLGYRMWKQAYLIGLAFGGKDFPNNPEKASPELYPPKKSIPMPDFLKEKWLKKGGLK